MVIIYSLIVRTILEKLRGGREDLAKSDSGRRVRLREEILMEEL